MVVNKSKSAFRTIAEVADELGVATHVLRFWETKFPQIKPMKRTGGRRYYRPDDVELVRKIKDLLYEKRYTIEGVQKLFKNRSLKDILGTEIQKDFKNFLRVPIDISKAHHSMYVIGLCLTYHVNYGLSYRQTSSILNDIHNVTLSHKTVENYCKSVSSIVQYILEFYPYVLSDSSCADETYIKVAGKTQYVFFYFDAIKKIVTSYRVFEHRDSLSSIKAAYSTLKKYKELPDSLKIITDGNPIYNVAVQYWTQHGMPFHLYQVIGLKNLDETSKKYRSSKQIIERHNRTLKYYYRPKNGFSSNENANNYMVLFATFFNFLRPNSALNYHVPVEIPEVQECSNMPNKWIELINLSYDYIKQYA